jgi:hypothetical protein
VPKTQAPFIGLVHHAHLAVSQTAIFARSL